MFCSKCGKQIDDEAMICPECGCATKNMVGGKNVSLSKKNDAAVQEIGTATVNNRKNKKIIIGGIIAAVLLVLAVAFLALRQPESTESYSLANTNAKLVYTNATTYCVKCEVNNAAIVSGFYKVDLSEEASDYLKNGKDFEGCLQYMMGTSSGNGGYALVEVGKGGIVVNSYWCRKDCFGSDYSDFDISKVNSKKYVVGSYPDENYPKG